MELFNPFRKQTTDETLQKAKQFLGGITVDPNAVAKPGETVPAYMGRRIREAAIDSYKPINDAVSSVSNAVGSFISGVSGNPTTPQLGGATLRNGDSISTLGSPAAADNTQRADVAKQIADQPAAQSVTDPAAKMKAGPMQPVAAYKDDLTNMRTTATTPGGGSATYFYDTGANDRAVLPGARTGQVWAGAATDAEAARALQDRTFQNQAAAFNVANMESGANAERDTRAAKLGIDRATLDKMEGRAPNVDNSPTLAIGAGPDKLDVASGRVINRDTPINVVQDRMRNAVIDAKRFGAGGKAGREAAKAIGQAYQDDKALQKEELSSAASLQTARENARNNLLAQQLTQDRLDQRATADREAEMKRYGLGLQKDYDLAQFNAGQTNLRESAEATGKQFDAGAEHIRNLTTSKDGKPAQLDAAKWNTFLSQIDVGQTATGLGVSTETAKRWKAGKLLPHEAQWLSGQAQAWSAGQPGFWSSMFKDAPTAQSYVTPSVEDKKKDSK